MFTGIIQEVGSVRAAATRDNALALEIAAPGIAPVLSPGESVAVNGVCQTVVASTPDSFSVQAMGPTLSRTTLGTLKEGDAVNLERALAFGDRLGGHLLQGHVDAVGRVRRVQREGEHVLLDVELAEDIAEVTVLHGSIAIDGVSLTVNALPAEHVAQVALIPFTWGHTNLSRRSVGDAVNLEGDMLGRFVVAYLKRTGR